MRLCTIAVLVALAVSLSSPSAGAQGLPAEVRALVYSYFDANGDCRGLITADPKQEAGCQR